LSFNDSELVALAVVVKEWGVKGEMKVLPLSRNFTSIATGSCIFLSSLHVTEKVTLEAVKPHNRFFIISLSGINDRESAAAFRNAYLKIKKSEIPIEKDEYLYDQIIGLRVVTTSGEEIGRVDSIFETGSNDVYVVRKENAEYLIPAIRDVIQTIDLEKGQIIIRVMEGLLD